VPARVVLDCGVGPAMESADLCIVGAEGVMENGGIVNKVRATDLLKYFKPIC
jgi:translation initiation factor eIF-2B subunit alpha